MCIRDRIKVVPLGAGQVRHYTCVLCSAVLLQACDTIYCPRCFEPPASRVRFRFAVSRLRSRRVNGSTPSDVGKSCILVTIGGKNILLDCGMHPGYNDNRRFPDFRSCP
eukprot:784665-Rhodomonas_salina.2